MAKWVSRDTAAHRPTDAAYQNLRQCHTVPLPNKSQHLQTTDAQNAPINNNDLILSQISITYDKFCGSWQKSILGAK